ncbi:uncharacterized protein BDW70DRAFT_89685 [Aspergillus foveolatus]|uniref:uncharacterized protein n=1 Tax=Aspergillus foveolatus TaxID=210207 RepID=UPI003CCDF495
MLLSVEYIVSIISLLFLDSRFSSMGPALYTRLCRFSVRIPSTRSGPESLDLTSSTVSVIQWVNHVIIKNSLHKLNQRGNKQTQRKAAMPCIGRKSLTSMQQTPEQGRNEGKLNKKGQ